MATGIPAENEQHSSTRPSASWPHVDDGDQRMGRRAARQSGYKYRRPAPGAGRNRRLSVEEEKELLAAVNQHSNPMMGWIVGIALETGMRWSEILTLRRIQVDLDRRIVRLLKTKNTQPRTSH